MDAGKHVYVEKPMTHTVEQQSNWRNAVKQTGRFFRAQTGTANDSYWQAHDAIQAGRIGKVTWAHGS